MKVLAQSGAKQGAVQHTQEKLVDDLSLDV